MADDPRRHATRVPFGDGGNGDADGDQTPPHTHPPSQDHDEVTLPARRRPGRPSNTAPVAEVHTRNLILRHARALFMQRGFADVSVGEIAEAVGVSKPTLYYHFGDKEGLYAAVLIDLMREVGQYIRQLLDSPLSLRDRLVELAYGYFLHADATMEPLLRDTSELIGRERAQEVLAAYEAGMIEPIAALFAEGIAHGELAPRDPRWLVRAILGLFDAFTAPGGHLARSDEEHRRVSEQLIALFLDGARSSAAASQ